VNLNRSLPLYVLTAIVAFVAILVFEAAFYDEISWATVILAPIATVIGVIIGDSIRGRQDSH
jgi:hypothetical protein